MKSLKQVLTQPEIYLILIAWTMIWKGVALWKAARKDQLIWFILILGINTLGLLEIAYIYYLYRWNLGSKKLRQLINKKLGKRKEH